jgi:hypothetical protein
MDTQPILDRSAFALGLLGSVLGVLSTWRLLAADRVRLRVDTRPAWVDGRLQAAIHVVNLSTFPVTVQNVGFTLRGKRGCFLYVAPDPRLPDRLPQRLEPRTCLTVLVPPAAEDGPEFRLASRPVAHTACGETHRGPARTVQAYHKLRAASAATQPPHHGSARPRHP